MKTSASLHFPDDAVVRKKTKVLTLVKLLIDELYPHVIDQTLSHPVPSNNEDILSPLPTELGTPYWAFTELSHMYSALAPTAATGIPLEYQYQSMKDYAEAMSMLHRIITETRTMWYSECDEENPCATECPLSEEHASHASMYYEWFILGYYYFRGMAAKRTLPISTELAIALMVLRFAGGIITTGIGIALIRTAADITSLWGSILFVGAVIVLAAGVMTMLVGAVCGASTLVIQKIQCRTSHDQSA
jgi:hypothetical protein